jgi:SagB-type dehydrogenase family enzyme
MRAIICVSLVVFSIGAAPAKDSESTKLPPPHTTGGMPLMQALKERHSTREFSAKPLSAQVLSDLLWAASGVNRPDSGKRTAPSARDRREIMIYVAMADGAYAYAPEAHTLQRVVARDLRALTGQQDFVVTAPVNLVYVADLNRMGDASAEDKTRYAAADTGFIAQNVYLFCAANGLGAVVRGLVDREALGAALGLAPHQQIVLAQTVGYPK